MVVPAGRAGTEVSLARRNSKVLKSNFFQLRPPLKVTFGSAMKAMLTCAVSKMLVEPSGRMRISDPVELDGGELTHCHAVGLLMSNG